MLALAFDPFVQNLLSYYTKAVPDSNLLALLPRAVEYGAGGTQAEDLDRTMKSYIIGGYSGSTGYNVS